MVRKIAIVGYICVLAWIVVDFFRPSIPSTVYNVGDAEFVLKSCEYDDRAAAVVREINRQNATIQSVEGTVEAKTKYRFINLSGHMAYLKDDFFRLTISSRLAKEIDIGSNETDFWFMSRRYEGNTLFRCPVKDADKAKLKDPFNPAIMKQALGYGEIDADRSGISWYKNFVAVCRVGTGKPGRIVTLINPDGPRVAGLYVYDKQETLLASTEVTGYDGIFPKKWLFVWKTEGASMELELLAPSYNRPISPAQWQVPNASRVIDMSKD